MDDILNNNLNAMPQWVIDSSGKITGYKTKGGADTVFPFSSTFKSFEFRFDTKGNQNIQGLSKGDLIIVTGGTSAEQYSKMNPSNINGGELLTYMDDGKSYPRGMFIIKATSTNVSFTVNPMMYHYNSMVILKL